MQSVRLRAHGRAFGDIVTSKRDTAGRYDAGQAARDGAEEAQSLVDDGVEQGQLFEVCVREVGRHPGDLFLQSLLQGGPGENRVAEEGQGVGRGAGASEDETGGLGADIL